MIIGQSTTTASQSNYNSLN